MPADSDFITCDTETRAMPYQADLPVKLQVTSRAGTFRLKVLQNTFTDPSMKVLTEPPAKGNDVWTIETDSADASTPVDGLMIAVSPYMPDHRHGTTPVGVTANGGGTYTIAPLNLYMAGYWEITFDITDTSSGTSVIDSALVPICVPD